MNINIKEEKQAKPNQLINCAYDTILIGDQGSICIKLNNDQVIFINTSTIVIDSMDECHEDYAPFHGTITLSN
jgi:hypothetical protein